MIGPTNDNGPLQRDVCRMCGYRCDGIGTGCDPVDGFWQIVYSRNVVSTGLSVPVFRGPSYRDEYGFPDRARDVRPPRARRLSPGGWIPGQSMGHRWR